MSPLIARRRLVLAALAPGIAPAHDAPAWPSRPVHVVVPFSSGGVLDGIARRLSERLSPRLGQTLVVDSRPGASGNLGMEAVARAPADGHTWLAGSTVAAINPALMRMSFDPLRDLVPVVLLGRFPVHFYGRAGLPARTHDDLLHLMRSSAQGLTCATSGGITLLAAEQLRQRAQAPLVIVSYKGITPGLTDLAAGHVDLAVAGPGNAAALVRAGRIRRLGASDAAAGPGPDPLRDLDLWGWYGLFAPAGTPAAVVLRMNREVNDALADPALASFMQDADVVPEGGPPARLAEVHRSDAERFARIARAAGLAP